MLFMSSYIFLFQPDKPVFVTEFWIGWFDHWGERHHVVDDKPIASALAKILDEGGSFIFYMWHGKVFYYENDLTYNCPHAFFLTLNIGQKTSCPCFVPAFQTSFYENYGCKPLFTHVNKTGDSIAIN